MDSGRRLYGVRAENRSDRGSPGAVSEKDQRSGGVVLLGGIQLDNEDTCFFGLFLCVQGERVQQRRSEVCLIL